MLPFYFEKSDSFTLVELLVVVGIVTILASIVMVQMRSYIESATMTRAKAEMRTMEEAIQMYMNTRPGQYPADVNRGMPPGLENYLSSKPDWPNGPWENSNYDWDRWDSDSNPRAGNLAYNPEGEVIQISVRFCEMGDPSTCKFPNTDWAENFKVNSSVYWCLKGACRAHGSEPFDYPGCCIGGNCSNAARKCN